ncbi:MAG: hypothetical protein EB125_03510 [Betaproteobacteria bacterium]|nr:hypothetical protein [Betaproteobacteria bacterium]
MVRLGVECATVTVDVVVCHAPGVTVHHRPARFQFGFACGRFGGYGVCGSRSVLWTNVWQLIVQKPWLGWGWGETDLAHFLTLYPGQRFCDILDNAHNLPLHLALEFGVPLAVCVLLCVVRWVWVRKPWREHAIWRVMAWGVLLVVGLHSLLEYPLWYGPFQMAVGLCVGLLWVKLNHDHTVHHEKATFAEPFNETTSSTADSAGIATTSKAHEAWSLLLACVFFMAFLYAAWDFNRVSQIYKPVAQRDPTYSSNPLAYAKQSWLFRNQAEFAELTMQQVTASNAQAVYDQAQRVVHYSPEPRVVQRLIDSARLLGHDDEADHWALRLAAHHLLAAVRTTRHKRWIRLSAVVFSTGQTALMLRPLVAISTLRLARIRSLAAVSQMLLILPTL